MKILFIGGTRLLGKKIVELFIASGQYDITVLSRKADFFSDSCHILSGERSQVLKEISGQHFDFIFDFIAYKPENVREVIERLKFDKYIFISTCWIRKLNQSVALNDFVNEIDPAAFEILPDITKEYLFNKQQSEIYIRDNVRLDRYTVLRLPIFFGPQDHTGRLEFYISRLQDNEPIIVVNGGENDCQIAYVDDLASAIVNTFMVNRFKGFKILEAIPEENISVTNLMLLLKNLVGSDSDLINISKDLLQERLPAYLDQEPLWRENYMPASDNNIFAVSGQSCSPLESWLSKVIPSIIINNQSYLRELELNLIKEVL